MTTRAQKQSNVETQVTETPMTQETPMTPVEMICSGCNDLDIYGLKQVVQFCQKRIDELKKTEVELLESEMRAIQEKLMAIKGNGRGNGNGNTGKKRADRPLVNPKNPDEVYIYGKTPEWLSKWMAETGKSVAELRNEASKRMAETGKSVLELGDVTSKGM